MRGIVTAIEIGTSAIKAVMGRSGNDGTLHVIGYARRGTLDRVVKGTIQDVTVVQELLTEAVNELEHKTDKRIGRTYLAVSGDHVTTKNIQSSVPITTGDRVIRDEHVIAATRSAREWEVPVNKVELQTFQRSYLIDDHRRCSQPVGQIGRRLTADVHYVIGDYDLTENHCHVIEEVLGNPADDLSFSPIADFYALRSPEDPDAREGMLLIDFGAGVTEYVVFYDGGCMHSGQITVGCDHVANDLSLGLGIGIGEARELFRTHAEVAGDPAKTGELLKLSATLGHDPRRLRRRAVEQIVDARLRELFSLIRDELLAEGVLGLVGRRIEICGGGANLPGITNLLRDIFGIPARVGLPGNVAGLPSEIATPQWVTPIGLLIVGNEMRKVEQTGSLPLGRQLAYDAAQFFNLCRKAFRI